MMMMKVLAMLLVRSPVVGGEDDGSVGAIE